MFYNIFEVKEFLKLASKKLKKKYPEFAGHIDLLSDNIKGKYVEWAIKRYIKGDYLSELITQIQLFDQKLQALPKDKRDLNKFKDLEELKTALEELALKPRREVKVETDEAKKLYEDKRYALVRPDTKKTSCEFGSGTKWCITMQNADYFNQYQSDNVVFYFLIDKTLPSNNPNYKIAFAVHRDLDCNVIGVQAFNAVDHEVYYSKYDDSGMKGARPAPKGYDKVRNIIEKDAKSLPPNAIVYAYHGLLSDEEFNYFLSLQDEHFDSRLVNEKYHKFLKFDIDEIDLSTPEARIQALKSFTKDYPAIARKIIRREDDRTVFEFIIRNRDLFKNSLTDVLRELLVNAALPKDIFDYIVDISLEQFKDQDADLDIDILANRIIDILSYSCNEYSFRDISPEKLEDIYDLLIAVSEEFDWSYRFDEYKTMLQFLTENKNTPTDVLDRIYNDAYSKGLFEDYTYSGDHSVGKMLSNMIKNPNSSYWLIEKVLIWDFYSIVEAMQEGFEFSDRIYEDN